MRVRQTHPAGCREVITQEPDATLPFPLSGDPGRAHTTAGVFFSSAKRLDQHVFEFLQVNDRVAAKTSPQHPRLASALVLHSHGAPAFDLYRGQLISAVGSGTIAQAGHHSH